MFIFDTSFWLNLGIFGLVTVAFIESIFFPLPPDLILIPLALAYPQNALFYAFVATLFSSMGGIGGHYIGKHAGREFMKKHISERHALQARQIYKTHGALAVFLAALTPIPYKVFTILSGVLDLDLKTLFIVSLFGRGVRFFAESMFIYLYGKEAISLLASNIELATTIAGAGILVAYLIYVYVKKRFL